MALKGLVGHLGGIESAPAAEAYDDVTLFGARELLSLPDERDAGFFRN